MIYTCERYTEQYGSKCGTKKNKKDLHESLTGIEPMIMTFRTLGSCS